MKVNIFISSYAIYFKIFIYYLPMNFNRNKSIYLYYPMKPDRAQEMEIHTHKIKKCASMTVAFVAMPTSDMYCIAE